MLVFIRENTTLLLGMFLALFTLSLGGYRNPVLAAIARKGAPPDAFRRLKWPASVLARARRSRRWSFLILTAAFIVCFCLGVFLYLQDTQSSLIACLAFLPLSLLGMHVLYYLLWLCSYLVYACIDVGNTKFNLMFSVTTLELLLICLTWPVQGQISAATFGCILINLFFCYVFTAWAMQLVLRETLRQTTTFTHHNLWKVALTLCTEFLVELTFFCYGGACYFEQAYNVPINLLDAFYFVTVSFGTIGYGDIVPTCSYSKLISILITFTSITCIGVMFSSFLSAGTEKKNDSVDWRRRIHFMDDVIAAFSIRIINKKLDGTSTKEIPRERGALS